MRLASAAALGLMLSSVACGAESTSDPSGLRECSDVWNEGAELPTTYSGCTVDGQLVTPELHECNSDGDRWTTYDRFAAVLGGEIFVFSEAGDVDTSVMVTC